jgi:hypothetical protein
VTDLILVVRCASEVAGHFLSLTVPDEATFVAAKRRRGQSRDGVVGRERSSRCSLGRPLQLSPSPIVPGVAATSIVER